MNDVKIARIDNRNQIGAMDKIRYAPTEVLPYAKRVPLQKLIEEVYPDREGEWVNSIFVVYFDRKPTQELSVYTAKTLSYLEDRKQDLDMDILSISASFMDGEVRIAFFVRVYGLSKQQWPDFRSASSIAFVEPIHITEKKTEAKEQPVPVSLDDGTIAYQKKAYEECPDNVPFLNQIDNYVSAPCGEQLIYDLEERLRQIKTIMSYKDFNDIFERCMEYITSVEGDAYRSVIKGNAKKETFLITIQDYIQRYYINTGKMLKEDEAALMSRLDRALFQSYIIQDLIDDKRITDIKITAPDSIRVRINGKAMISNVEFINDADYYRFFEMLAIKNNLDLREPVQTFTDATDPDYILRYSVVAPYITPGYPVIHIRKIAKRKLLGSDLLKAEMMDEKVMHYLLDCGKNSRGVVFAGPPGSGKTVILNWFLEEAYEDSAEILVIQENDELFCYRKGVMFEHVVTNPMKGERACNLEKLGEMALVAGANVFVIGEAKGAEICSAITLSNSGCRTAITIHSPSANETLDKMADLALRGYSQSYEQALRSLKSFQTIVYMQDFKVQEISEITGFDEETKKITYKAIYKRSV